MHYPKLKEGSLFFIASPDSIEALSHFLQQVLGHFSRYHSSNGKTFFEKLHIITDCYRLTLATLHSSTFEDARLHTFTRCIERGKPFRETEKLALVLSEMIHLTIEKIRLLINPWYQCPFVEALTYLFSNRIAYLQEGKSTVEKLKKYINFHLMWRKCA